MELKDWLGIILPLIGDGIVLYLIHFYFERIFLKKQAQKEHCVEAIKKYQELVGKASYVLQQLVYKKTYEEIVEIINETSRIIAIDIDWHYNLHKDLLEPIKAEHESLCSQMNQIIAARKINDVGRVKILIQGLHQILRIISNACDERIFKHI